MKHKDCFVNGHCAYDCPNFQVDYFEEKFDLPASELVLRELSAKSATLIRLNAQTAILKIQITVRNKSQIRGSD